MKTWGGPHNDYADVEPGFNWDITPRISINPYVNIVPGSASWATSSLNFNLSVKYL
jgi:hypothetical protein